MSKLKFFKYQATGNDFVLLDNRGANIMLSVDDVQRICDRHFGVGADGLMLLENHPDLDFNLVYYNSDGTQSLCGNGSRAAVKMASSLGMINGHAKFNAYDGVHEAELSGHDIIKIKMMDVESVQPIGDDYFIQTGSPHFIRFVENLEDYPVVEEGRKIRNSADFLPGGTNVNFVEKQNNNTLFVRTYERGVENETLSCGTGITAAALASYFRNFHSPVQIKSKGGSLSVEFSAHPAAVGQGVTFHDISLIGPAKMVFEGELEL